MARCQVCCRPHPRQEPSALTRTLGSVRGGRGNSVPTVTVTFGEAEPLIVSVQADGAVGVDVNADHLAIAHVSGAGRLLGAGREALGPDRNGMPVAVQSICDQAAARGVPVVAENLDFRNRKAWLRQYGKRFGNILSNFRSRQEMAALER